MIFVPNVFPVRLAVLILGKFKNLFLSKRVVYFRCSTNLDYAIAKQEKTSKSKWLDNSIWLRDKILKELGIRVEDLTSFQSFARLLHEPRDPSGLAVIRILYGMVSKLFKKLK
ncbi:hypothetical protein CDAR_71231 [Caerostris darwini]|uniref:Uncharacterized protein n=1 Tax=Caerostris darwini TaxID=1538125 RepID=A0AAV4WFM1_9ARAC|nr:hypothetical protein CDAR_71231 [Caerostris darwini]